MLSLTDLYAKIIQRKFKYAALLKKVFLNKISKAYVS